MSRYLKIIGTACALTLLGACATVDQTHGPDGRTAYTVTCSGDVLSWSDCDKKAGDTCGASGYRVVSKTGDKGFAVGWLGGGSVQTRSMLIECGDGAA